MPRVETVLFILPTENAGVTAAVVKYGDGVDESEIAWRTTTTLDVRARSSASATTTPGTRHATASPTTGNYPDAKPS